MLEETRLHRIRALLSTLNQVSTEQLVQHLGVSRETVRRDILKLESMGALRRVHGGILATGPSPELPLSVRNTVREKEKHQIARAAVKQLTAGQTLFIDAGSTTTILAEQLASMPGLTIITNSLNVALKLNSLDSEHLNHDVILLGGQMGSAQATCGPGTVSEILRYRADVALLAPVGVSSQAGASSYAHQEAEIAGAMARNARQCIILADCSKIGVESRISYASIEQIDMIITDSGAATADDLPELQRRCEQVLLV